MTRSSGKSGARRSGARGDAPGKKVGDTGITLQRADPRAGRAYLTIEIRLDVDRGTFHARHDGQWYEAKTKDALIEQIRNAAQRTVDVQWQRYLVVDYEAEARPLEGDSGRPRDHGEYETLSIEEDRSSLAPDPSAPSWALQSVQRVVTSIGLTWCLCEFSTPYPRVEDGKIVRMRREIKSHPLRDADRQIQSDEHGEEVATHEEWTSDPKEQDDDQLPVGAVPWSPAREQVLRDVLAALGALDARMAQLFRGDAEAVARRIDDVAARGQPILAAPSADRDGDDPIRDLAPTGSALDSDDLPPNADEPASARRGDPIRLAFLVEDDADKTFVETLVPRLFPDPPADASDLFLHVVVLGRRDALDRARDEAVRLSDAGYDGIFAIADANTTSINVIWDQQADLQRRVTDGLPRAHAFVAVSAMECWLLSDYLVNPERAANPLRALVRHAPDRSVTDLAASLRIEQARQRSPSLDALLARVESVVEEARERRRAPSPPTSPSAPKRARS